MRYWFDTEFDERGKIIHLISLGIVAEDGRTFYAVNADYDQAQASPWLQENVLPFLQGQTMTPLSEIRASVLEFFNPAPQEIWAYYGEYDWIVLRQLCGHMVDWPEGWPLSHMNLAQLHAAHPQIVLPTQDAGTLHHALEDARWCQTAWQLLSNTN